MFLIGQPFTSGPTDEDYRATGKDGLRSVGSNRDLEILVGFKCIHIVGVSGTEPIAILCICVSQKLPFNRAGVRVG
jgi:hypothetical protein